MSLVEVSDYRDALKIEGSSEDTKIKLYAEGIEERVKQFLGRDLELTDYVELVDGDGDDFIVVDQFPITTITKLEVYEGISGGSEVWEEWNANDEYDRLIDEDTRIFIEGNIFPRGRNNIRVTYTAGYTNIPYDIQAACIELMLLRYGNVDQERLGVVTEQKTVGAGSSDTYDLNAESRVLRKIQHYRRARV